MSRNADRLKREMKEQQLREFDHEVTQQSRIERRFRKAGMTVKQLDALGLWDRASALASSWAGGKPSWADTVEAAMLMLAEVTERVRAGTLDEFIAGLPSVQERPE